MRLVVVPDPEALAVAAAELMRDRVTGQPDLAMGVPAGRTPRRMYALLRGFQEKAPVDYSRMRVFAIDERRGFELRTHASSVKELRDHWAVSGSYDPEEKDETLVRRQDEMYARAHEVLDRSSGAELVYVEPATMSRLTPA